ncbi:hypothetical protein DFJ58DRAFT_737662 [Suillus subalutaceus]|uniref:uncharacterized protein n=1 Tax=Suillus subalutaceus TaxID=48586 RepID=UPI001B8730E5|nr:uncharacterized protein DFJ58DRAFT_737662 [Suillus subalutaceus]KAG1828748.1 hypothetical protein DFJ58DRAFT_737662 [Suillus subalutaceus]
MSLSNQAVPEPPPVFYQRLRNRHWPFTDGFLLPQNRPSYLRLSCRSNSIFANQRDTLYDMFEIYRKFKKQKHHFNVVDQYGSFFLDSLDPKLIPNSTHAILKVLRNQKFPGQQVDYLYVDEVQDNLLIDAMVLRRLCRNSDGLFWAGDTAQTISAGSSFRFNDLKVFVYHMERHNHTMAFVNYAHSVIELITKFWPNTIDHLQHEKGLVDGAQPVFFMDVDNDAHCKQFLVGERTLHDSKGLEFDDVLLYNFFGDSAVDASRWRIVLNGVQGQGYAPDFYRDETRYAAICSELKHLYVGITRARKNIWIFDTSNKSDAMRIFWKSQDLICTCARGIDVSPLAVSSTLEEWASSGRSLFLHKHYSQAIHCFKRANLHLAFTAAAEAFADCGTAATGNERHQYYCTSADCYARGGQDLKAADTYLKAEEFELAAKKHRKAGSFDRTLHVLTDHHTMIPEKTATDLRMVCRLHYCGGSDDQVPVPLFSSFDEELEFLEEYDLDCTCVSLLESCLMYYEVAEIHLSENCPMEAVQAFLKDNRNIDSTSPIALADQLQMKKLEPMTRNLVLMFQSILNMAITLPLSIAWITFSLNQQTFTLSNSMKWQAFLKHFIPMHDYSIKLRPCMTP